MADRPFAAVAILGLGAMGGSLARALSALPEAPVVTGWSPVENERRAALEAAAVARAPDDWRRAVADVDLVVVAAPLEATCELVVEVASATDVETTVTDLASLKAPVARAVAAAGVEERWVGAHPMTGSEESGFAASRADLYRGARVWTVASPHAAARSAAIECLWKAIGARPEAIGAGEHDRMMALASHLPQLTSNALAEVLTKGGMDPERLGPGGTDMIRLAASAPAMWRDIFAHASPELVDGLRALSEASGALADLVERGDLDGLEQMMATTRAWSRPS